MAFSPAPRRHANAPPRSIAEWLEGVKEGYGARFGPAFESAGAEGIEDLAELAEEEASEALTQALERCGAKAVQLQKIRRALAARLEEGPPAVDEVLSLADAGRQLPTPQAGRQLPTPQTRPAPVASGLRVPAPPPEPGTDQDLELLSQLMTGPRLAAAPPLIPRPGTVTPSSPCGYSVLRSGDGPHLYLVHSIDGEIFQPGSAFQFVTHLLGNCHCTALEYNDDAAACNSVVALASFYLRRILQDVQRSSSNQTIYVAGYSFGCIVAHEVAVQLQDIGKRVGLVLLGSEVTWPAGSSMLRMGGYPWLGGPIEAALHVARNLGAMDFAEQEVLALLDVPEGKRDVNRVHMRTFWKHAGAADMPYEDFMYTVTRGARNMDEMYEILHKHEPTKSFSGQAFLLLAKSSQEFETARERNQQHCSQLKVSYVAGTHYDMLKHQHAPQTAKAILDWLQEGGECVSVAPTPSTAWAARSGYATPSAARAAPRAAAAAAKPAGPTKEQLSDKVLKILNEQVMEPLDLGSDIMEGGLDSISMSLVATQLQQDLGVQLTAGKIMELEKVSDLVDFIFSVIPSTPLQQTLSAPIVAAAPAVSKGAVARAAQPAARESDVQGMATMNRGNGPRAYLVHGIDADIFAPGASYSAVAPMLAPCHTLALLYDEQAYQCESLEKLAAEYNRRVLEDARRHPGSPVFVVGYSFGCVIAHQMALQLQAGGVNSSLILVDFEVSYPPAPSIGRLGGYEWLGGEIEATLLMSRSMGGFDGIQWAADQTKVFLEQAADKRDVPAFQNLAYDKIASSRKGFSRKQFQLFCDKGGRNMERLNKIANPWAPADVFKGEALLVLAPDSKDFHCAQDINLKYCSSMEVMYALGTHYSILQAALAPKAAGCILTFMRRLGHEVPEAPSMPDIPGLVTLSKGDGPRLYMVHGIDGDIFSVGASYTSIAPLLTPCHSSALAYDDEAARCDTIPALAALYNGRLFQDMVRHMGSPIFIVGYSFGCVVAHQMALQIKMAAPDAEVNLILYDFEVSFPPAPSPGRLGGYDWLGGPVEASLLMVRAMGGVEGIMWGEEQTKALLAQTPQQRDTQAFQQRTYEKIAASRKGFAMPQFQIFCDKGGRAMDQMHNMADPWAPQAPFVGKTLLVLAEDSKDFHCARDINEKHCSSMETVYSPGTHYSILQAENAPTVARETLAFMKRHGFEVALGASDK